jgi:hypothetical protein
MAGTYGGVCMFQGVPSSAYGGSTDPATQARFCQNYPGCAECQGAVITVPPPVVTTGGSGSPPPPTVIPSVSSPRPSCGSCRSRAPAIIAGAPSPAGPGTVTARAVPKAGYPWWVIVLAVLILAQLVEGSRE